MKALHRLLYAVMILIMLLSVGGATSPPYKVAVVYSNDLQDYKEKRLIQDNSQTIRELKPNVKFRTYHMNYQKQMSEKRLHENARVVYQDIQKFHPDLVLVYDTIAFEHITLQYLIPNKYNNIFFGIPNSDYEFLHQSYQLNQHKNLSGVVTVCDEFHLRALLNILELDNIYIIKSDARFATSQSIVVKSHTKNHNVQTFNVSTLLELKTTLTKLNDSPKGILVFMIPNILDSNTQAIATKEQISNVIVKYNSKHFELSYIDNMTRYGVGSSDIIMQTQHTDSIYDDTIREKINKNKASINFKKSQLVVNVERIQELGYDIILTHPELVEGTDEFF